MIRRWMFNFAAVLSLLLCAATVALWVRSYRGCDYFARTANNDDSTGDFVHNIELGGIRGAMTITERLAIRRTPIDGPSGPVNVLYQRGVSEPRGVYPTVDLASLPDFPGVPERTLSVHFARFAFVLRDQSQQGLGFRERNVVMIVPLPIAAALAALLPAVWSYRHWNRRTTGQLQFPCPSCSYNLTGNTSGVCPECGTVVPSRPRGVA